MGEKHEESTNLLQRHLPNSSEQSDSLRDQNKRIGLTATLVLFAVLFLLGTTLFRRESRSVVGLDALELDTKASYPLQLEISNEYPALESLELYPWDYIAEPYKLSKLRLITPEPGVQYSWSIVSDESSVVVDVNMENAEGSEVSAIFKEAGHFYTVKVEESGGENRSFQTQIICKYVRREVRDLTQLDRVKFFNAMRIFHSVSLEEGRKLYGPTFFTHKELTVLHVMATANNTCTPWHANYGSFIYSHMAMALWMEQALRLIDPSISMPYWDYIADSVNYGADFDQSEIFTDDLFGEFQPYPYQVLGKWTNLPLATVTSEVDLQSEHNSYGIITTWHNNNPSKTLQRSNEICGWKLQQNVLPDCSAIHSLIRAFSLGSAWDAAVGLVHSGNLHIIAGGAWDCAEDYKEVMTQYGDDANGQKARAYLESFLLESQVLWEMGYYGGVYTDPGICAEGTAYEDCRFSCSAVHLDEMDDLTDDEVYKYLDSFNFMSLFESDMLFDENTLRWTFVGVDAETDAKLKLNLLKLGCVNGKESPFFSPLAGTDDPLFMPVHTFYQIHYDYVLLTKEHVSLYWDNDDVLSCYGHHSYDEMPYQWSGFLGELQDGELHSVYTYEDLIKIFEPTNPRLPYVHANFNWDYCNTDDFTDQHVKPQMSKDQD